jgi:hypothetical protein
MVQASKVTPWSYKWNWKVQGRVWMVQCGCWRVYVTGVITKVQRRKIIKIQRMRRCLSSGHGERDEVISVVVGAGPRF